MFATVTSIKIGYAPLAQSIHADIPVTYPGRDVKKAARPGTEMFSKIIAAILPPQNDNFAFA